MKMYAKLQAQTADVLSNNEAVTLTLETVLLLILVILGMSGLWVIVIKYIIGDGESLGFFGATKTILSDLFG